MQIETIIANMQQGDFSGFNAFYLETYQRVYFLAKKYLSNEQDALEVVQDVYVGVYQNIGTLKDTTVWRAWLGRITINQAIKKGERSKGKEDLSLDDELFPIPSDQIRSAEGELEEKETAEILSQMIDCLPPAQKEVVILYYFEEWSIKEIAEAMGVSQGTIKSRLNYARQSIKDNVLVLEKKGTKLYTITPELMMMALRFLQEGTSIHPDSLLQISNGISQATGLLGVGAKVGKSVASNAVLFGEGATVKTVIANALGSLTGKVVAGTLAVLLVAGGAVTFLHHQQSLSKDVPVSQGEVMQAEQSVKPAAAAPVETGSIIEFDDYTIKLSSCWDGKYTIQNVSDFYHTASMDMGGFEFGIQTYSDAEWLENSDLPGTEVLGHANGKTYVLWTPTDVQFEPSTEAGSEYQYLASDIKNIRNSFTLKNPQQYATAGEEETTRGTAFYDLLCVLNNENLFRMDSDEKLYGLFFRKLVDFDGDGTDELLIGYQTDYSFDRNGNETNYASGYRWAIYQWRNGIAFQFVDEMAAEFDGSAIGIGLLSKEGQTFVSLADDRCVSIKNNKLYLAEISSTEADSYTQYQFVSGLNVNENGSVVTGRALLAESVEVDNYLEQFMIPRSQFLE